MDERAQKKGRIEGSTLAALLILAAGVAGFVALMVVATGGEPHAFDTRILLALRADGRPDEALGPHWLELAMRDISSFASTTVLLLVMAAAVAYLLSIRRRAMALFVLIVLGGGQILTSVLKLAVDRPRPELVAHLVEVLTLSFPSGHAMGAALTYGTLGVLAAGIAPTRAAKICLLSLAVIVTLLVGVSRIYLGVHWPSDVMAGWCAGFAWAALCFLAMRYFGIGRSRP